MLSAGLGKYWLAAGKKVGYLKYPTSPGETAVSDPDALYMSKLLGLEAAAGAGPDIVITEGSLEALAAFRALKPNARVLLVHEYNDPLTAALSEYQKIGAGLLGVVINKVPRAKLATLRNQFAVGLGLAHISLIGLIPEDRVLMALSVADLADAVQGKIVNNAENASNLIENLMIGSSTFDRGPAYYGRKDKKAVLVWGERPGFRKAAVASLQLAALQTSTRCVVISGNAAPLPAAMQKADELKASIISAPGTLPEIAAAVEKAFHDLKFSQDAKLPRLQEILAANLDMRMLEMGLGIRGAG
jgi:BioD-like phosphotransacetylase family protein